MPAVKESLLQERRLALEIYRQMEDGTDSEIYQSLEKYFQDKIDALVEAGKQNNAELSFILEDAPEQRAELLEKETKLREELVEAINRKKAFPPPPPPRRLKPQIPGLSCTASFRRTLTSH